MQRVFWRLLVIVPFLIGAGLAPQAAESPVVNCYDRDRDQVQTVLRGDCNGEVVSDTEAAEIRERRVQRIQQRLQRQTPPPAPGKREVSMGSGFIVSREGAIVTNDHVIDSCELVSVTTTEGVRHLATVRARSGPLDLALLESGIEADTPATFAQRQDSLTDLPIVLIGYPNQGIAPIKPLLTPGRTLKRYLIASSGVMLPFSAAVRRGNSGGPVIDGGGRVIGVVTSKVDTVTTFQKTGRVIRDVGFAVSNDVVLRFLEKHRVAVATSAPRASKDQARIFTEARPYIVRIGCWR